MVPVNTTAAGVAPQVGLLHVESSPMFGWGDGVPLQTPKRLMTPTARCRSVGAWRRVPIIVLARRHAHSWRSARWPTFASRRLPASVSVVWPWRRH